MSNSAAASLFEIEHESHIILPGFGACDVLTRDESMQLLRRRGGERELLLTPIASTTSSEALLRINTQFELTNTDPPPGVVKARSIETGASGPVLVLEPTPGAPLSSEMALARLDDGLSIAKEVVRIVGELHKRGITHREVRPAAFLVSDGGRVALVDLGAASRSVQAASSVLPAWDRLPWVSPEQTSRMNRGFDRRADLYSIGALTYYLFSGRTPFEVSSALAMVHSHIAVKPDAPSNLRPELAGALEAVVLKLLEKRPEDRYQTARGLLLDLERLHEGISRTGRTPTLLPGKDDRPDWLQPPQGLYGRETEFAALRQALHGVTTGQTRTVALFGGPGLGKSSLARELQEPALAAGGAFVSGVFERVGSAVHGALVGALDEVVHHQLALDAAGLSMLRARLSSELANDLPVLVDLVPSLGLLVGEQPPAAHVPQTEARNRLHHALRRFVGAFCSPGAPLVLFLDDVQWADENSLALLEALGRVPGLLLMIAARPEAATEDHPLTACLNRMTDAGLGIQRLTLRPFDAATCNQLVADLLHSGPEETAPLADLLGERTSGNPMHFVQAIGALHEAGMVVFDHAKGHWAWSMQEVRRFGVDDNVARLLSTRIERLPVATRNVLRTLSVMSRRVALGSLVLASGQSAADLVHLMGHAEAEDLVLRDARNAAWGFIHDRVRDAVLETISERERAELNWTIAQRLVRGFGPDATEDIHFNIASHCLQARELVVASPWDQRISVVRLLVGAARRASDTLAFDTAREFLQLAFDTLGDDGWAREPELAFQTLHELGEARAFSRQREAAEQAFQQCLRRGKDPLELAEVHRTRTALCILTGDLAGALDTAREGLALVGVRLPRKPSKLTVALALLRSRMLLRGRKPSQLADMQQMGPGPSTVALNILSQILPAAYSHSEEMAGLAFLLMTNQALRHGNSGAAGHAYAIYGHIVSKVLGDPKTGYEFGRFGLELAQSKVGDPLSAVATGMAFATLLNHWQVDWRRSKDEFLRVVDEATSCGDLLNASHASSGLTMLHHVLAEPISELPTLTLEREAISRRSNYDDGTLYFGGARRWARHLMGLSKSRQSWDGEEGSEADFMAVLDASTFGPVRLGVITFRLSSHIIAGDIDAALKLALEHESSLHALSGQTFEVEFNFLAGLAAADALRLGRGDPPARRLLSAALKRLRKWSQLVAINVAGRCHVLEAQAAVVRGDLVAARRDFQAARAEARRRHDWHLVAFAAERQAQLDLAEGLSDQARGLMRVAREGYERWGAVAKLEWLQQDYPELELSPLSPSGARSSSIPLDMESALKAATALTSEIRLDRLLEKIVAVAVENAAASRGHLVLDEGGTLMLASSAQASEVAGISTATSGELKGYGTPLDEANVLARSIVRYVARTSEGIVLHDASADGRFASDPYLQQHPGISVLCQPLISQGKRLGILYLENDLAEGAFPPDRLRVMSLLSAQTAISLENARLYSDMQSLTDAQSRFVPYQFLENLHRPDIAQVKLGDHVTKDMSVLFADLRGFTRISEHLEPTEVVEMLNAFFSQMEGPIVEAGGFIDAFTGDEIMALFDTAPDRALHAGIGMARALEALNERRSDSLVLKMGMGINTGRLLLGTVGGRDRFKCGVVGNTVNLASRVEQLTKVYGATLLLGEETVRKLESPDAFSLREVDRIVVKGNNQPTTIYEVLDAESAQLRRLKSSIVDQLSAARERYLARNFKGALELYTDARVRAPVDRVPALFEERCRRYLAAPPPAEWDGVEPVVPA